METVIVSNSQFYSHYPRQIPKDSVNAEQVEIRLDKSWDGLTVRIHWLNVASGVEKVVLLELDQPNTIPWEVLADLGELRMGLVGLDGETVIKPTIWLTYGYVVDGVDPEAGEDPQPPTPSWEQQMVEQARVAAEAAEKAKDAAVNAGKAASQAGPYADEAQKSAEAAKEAQRAASTSAQEAGDARDQANTASNAAKVHADAAGTAKVAAERAAETAGNAQSGAALSAQTAANSAREADDAKREAQKAAAILPAPTQEDAGKFPMVNPTGDGYVFGEAGGGKINDSVLGKDTTWSSRMIVDSLAPAFEESGPVVTCNPVPGYPLSVVSQIAPVQDGEGDPTPDNVRPIVGWSRSNLWVGGKNLLSLLDYTDIKNGPIVNENEIIFSKNLGVVDYVFQSMKPGQYTVSFKRSGYSGIEVTVGGEKVIANGGRSMYKGTFTVAMDEVVTISLSEGQNPNREQRIASDVMLTFGDHSGYERYKQGSDVKFISFDQTVYGGTLDWMTGVLTVTRVGYEFDGTEGWIFYAGRFQLDSGVLAPKGKGLCSHFTYIEDFAGNGMMAWPNGVVYVGAGLTTLYENDVERWKSYLASQVSAKTPVQICYPISDPFTIQLSPTKVLALTGTNTLYTDTGDITVSGRADPNATIKGLLSRIDALEKAAIGGV